jgi:hypothetical protein
MKSNVSTHLKTHKSNSTERKTKINKAEQKKIKKFFLWK